VQDSTVVYVVECSFRTKDKLRTCNARTSTRPENFQEIVAGSQQPRLYVKAENRPMLDCPGDLLVVKTLALKAGLGPAKLPDIRTSFAIVSFQTPVLHSCPPAPPLRSRRIFRYGSKWHGRGNESVQ
jgi:hypothetical protein